MTLKQRFRQILDKILNENLPVKALCLFAALVLYGFYQFISIGHQTFTVPVTIKEEGLMTPASPWDPSVKVRLEGKKDEITGVTEADFSAVLDISYVSKEGEQKIPVRVELPPSLAKLETLGFKVTPDKISINIEQRVSAEIPLIAHFQGSAASGLDYRATLIPSTVQVSGPRSIVSTLYAISTEPIPLDGRAASFTAEVGIVPPPAIITMDDVPEDTLVTAAVILTERSASESFPVTVTPTGLESGLSLAETPEAVTIELTGPQNALRRIRESGLDAAIDLSAVHVPGTHTLPLIFEVPRGLSEVSRSADNVTVTVVMEARINPNAD